MGITATVRIRRSITPATINGKHIILQYVHTRAHPYLQREERSMIEFEGIRRRRRSCYPHITSKAPLTLYTLLRNLVSVTILSIDPV